jgi:hypothetical protein
MLAQDDRRSYVWAILEKDGVIKPSEDALVVASPWASAARTPVSTLPTRSTALPKSKPIPASPVNNMPIEEPVTATSVDREATNENSNASPIEQAIHLRGVLRDALAATNDLIGSLKRQQKQQRAYKSAIASLRELQGVA